MSDPTQKQRLGAPLFSARSWIPLLATSMMFFVCGVGFAAIDKIPQSAVTMFNCALMAFFAGYCFRARVKSNGTATKLRAFELTDDE